MLAEVAEQFDGADPIRPAKRETLEQLRAKLQSLKDGFHLLDIEAEMREPNDELLGIVRGLVWRENYPMTAQ